MAEGTAWRREERKNSTSVICQILGDWELGSESSRAQPPLRLLSLGILQSVQVLGLNRSKRRYFHGQTLLLPRPVASLLGAQSLFPLGVVHSGSLSSIRWLLLAEDKQQTAQQSLSQVLGAQSAGQSAQQGQEVLAGQAGNRQQEAGEQRSKQQREKRGGHGRAWTCKGNPGSRLHRGRTGVRPSASTSVLSSLQLRG